MLAYEYLKEHPQINAQRIQSGWAELFTDPDVPYAVKQEMLDLTKITDNSSDAALYFHGMLVYASFTGQQIDWYTFSTIMKYRVFCDRLYTYAQTHSPDSVTKLLLQLEVYRDVTVWTKQFTIPITEALLELLESVKYQDFEIIFNLLFTVGGNFTFPIVILAGLRGEPVRNYSHLDVIGVHRLVTRMSLKFCKEQHPDTLRRCIELLRDITLMDSMHFKSLNEVQRAHDDQTEQEVKKMLVADAPRFIYTEAFREIVESNGYKLPKDKNEFIARGYLHNNCVARYAERHTSFSITSVCNTRIIFSPNATAELNITHMYNLITMVKIVQYKGAYNKDYTVPLELVKIQIGLTGQPVDILKIEELSE
jgi:hypothetical protein